MDDLVLVQNYLDFLKNVTDLNLSKNPNIGEFPADMTSFFAKIENLNLEKIDFGNRFEAVIKSISTMPRLRSLYIEVHNQEQAGIIIQHLNDLEFLNGIKVQKEEAADSFKTDSDVDRDDGPPEHINEDRKLMKKYQPKDIINEDDMEGESQNNHHDEEMGHPSKMTSFKSKN